MSKGRIIFVFIVLSVGFYFVSSGIFGENGYFYNKTLEKLLTQREYQQDKISIELNSLIEKQIQLASEQGQKDAALSLGYYTKGDNVYLFTEASEQTVIFAGNIWDTDIKLYRPVGKTACLGVSLLVSALITFTIAFIVYIKHRDYSHDESSEEDNLAEFDNDDFRV